MIYTSLQLEISERTYDAQPRLAHRDHTFPPPPFTSASGHAYAVLVFCSQVPTPSHLTPSASRALLRSNP